MSNAMALSLLVNILVGLYFALGYPRAVRRSFRGQPPPPAFNLLLRILPPFGRGLVIASLAFGLYRWAG